MKIQRLYTFSVYFLIIISSILSCNKQRGLDEAVLPFKKESQYGHKLEKRYHKNDSSKFYFIIQTKHSNDLNFKDSAFHGNVFLIQPRRY